ncbi:hypothetical protein Tco_0483188, partial [Tanacetum coccineum]
SGVKGMILAAQGEAFDQENVMDENRKVTWFRSTDGKERGRKFVLHGSNMESVGRRCENINYG